MHPADCARSLALGDGSPIPRVELGLRKVENRRAADLVCEAVEAAFHTFFLLYE